jgi:hypothetical protein
MTVTAQDIRDLGDVIAAVGATINAKAPNATGKTVGTLIGLFGEYINGASNAYIEGHDLEKPVPEVMGQIFSEWLGANAGADVGLAVAAALPSLLELLLGAAAVAEAPLIIPPLAQCQPHPAQPKQQQLATGGCP